MREIGGYIELDHYRQVMLHDDGIALNCGRNCLAYLIKQKNIKSIQIPYYLCDSINNICRKEQLNINHYHIGADFLPKGVILKSDEWLYVVNYYGQLTQNDIRQLHNKYHRIIIDQAQAYFQMPLSGIDTLYTCRKFFGVTDGAILYTDAEQMKNISIDESFGRVDFLLGRFERTASEFYNEYKANNKLFDNEPIKRMSRLTDNLLHGIDYSYVKRRRDENYNYLFSILSDINHLNLKKIEGAFSYPLLLPNGEEIRKKLIDNNIYIPMLWPNVLHDVREDSLEYNMSLNILPLPVDQRYGKKDMEFLVEKVQECIN